MPSLALLVFWASFTFAAYAYVGYPLLLLAWRRVAARPVRRAPYEPELTLIIAAHNCGSAIEAKIQNCRSLDYPRERRHLVIALDGCTDDTEAVVRRLAGPDLEVVCLAEHLGKAAALNAGLARARGEVVVFADVRQRIEAGALRALLAPLADPGVGVVTGELLLADETGREARDGVGLYWRYEKKIRGLESDVHSVVGATGALYAVRRALVRPIPVGTLLDDVAIPMNAVLAGARCVFEPGARVLDRVACCAEVEYYRKVRTLAGNYQLVAQQPALLLPWRNPVWLQFVSHKIARLLVPYALLALVVSNLFLSGPFYAAFLVGQALFYGLAVLGAALDTNASRTEAVPSRARSEA
jgi:cellulose synthase/poly-beta-1,6-N-acetylglucosamine synthase-like glycosyltransferase